MEHWIAACLSSPPRTTDDRTQVPQVEREELLLRIDELRETLRHTRSEDVRVTLQDTLALCTQRLAELDEILGETP